MVSVVVYEGMLGRYDGIKLIHPYEASFLIEKFGNRTF